MSEIEKLEHVTVRVRDLDASRRFYTEVIGLRDGDRPPFPFPGAWLYAGDVAIVHLVGGEAYEAGSTGAFDHFALVADDADTMIARCDAGGIAYEERVVPDLELRQLFIRDPDGVLVELSFPGTA
ncbi:MAG: glyoxalase [Alphaproteobacteria bacterium]|nr:glyoxalase [Alphaproteobacteria bacterium]